jgi:hypothetical protein
VTETTEKLKFESWTHANPALPVRMNKGLNFRLGNYRIGSREPCFTVGGQFTLYSNISPIA